MLYKSSLITIDPKGENAAITARYRRDQVGHTVHILNPWSVHGSLFQDYGFGRATFNPLDVLDPKDPNIVGIANSLAVTICHQGSVNDSFWQDNATAMLAGIMLWVTDAPGETKTLGHVADIVSGGEKAGRTFGETGRALLFPDEIMSMGKGTAFAFQPRGRAHYLKPVDYWHLSVYLSPRLEQAKAQVKLPDLDAFDLNPFYDQARREQEQAAKTSGTMDRAEALAMLGLEEGATDDQVNEAYKRLMGMLHPDRGGTNYLAQKLNQARDLLRGKKK